MTGIKTFATTEYTLLPPHHTVCHIEVDILNQQVQWRGIYLDTSFGKNDLMLLNYPHHPMMDIKLLEPCIELYIKSPYRVVDVWHSFRSYECYNYYIHIESIALSYL